MCMQTSYRVPTPRVWANPGGPHEAWRLPRANTGEWMLPKCTYLFLFFESYFFCGLKLCSSRVLFVLKMFPFLLLLLGKNMLDENNADTEFSKSILCYTSKYYNQPKLNSTTRNLELTKKLSTWNKWVSLSMSLSLNQSSDSIWTT